MKATTTNTLLPLRNADFATLVEALEYAAQGETGYNFYDGKGELFAVLSYAELRDEARVLARRLLGLGCKRGARVAIVAESEPLFHRFFACQYAGYIPSRSCRLSDRRAQACRTLERMLDIAASARRGAGIPSFLRQASKPGRGQGHTR